MGVASPAGPQHRWLSSWSMHSIAVLLREKDNTTHSATTMSQLFLQNFHHILVAFSAEVLNQSRGAWSSASRNQGRQLSNATLLLLRSSSLPSSLPQEEEQSPPTTATELMHPPVRLSLPVAQKHPQNKTHQKTHTHSKQMRISSRLQHDLFFLIARLIIFLCFGVNCHPQRAGSKDVKYAWLWEFGEIWRFPYTVHLPQAVWDLFWATLLF